MGVEVENKKVKVNAAAEEDPVEEAERALNELRPFIEKALRALGAQ